MVRRLILTRMIAGATIIFAALFLLRTTAGPRGEGEVPGDTLDAADIISVVPPIQSKTLEQQVDLRQYQCSGASFPAAKTAIHLTLLKGILSRPLLFCGLDASLKFSNPDKHVVILWTDYATDPATLFPWLLNSTRDFPRLLLCPFRLELLVKGTPLESWYAVGNATKGEAAAKGKSFHQPSSCNYHDHLKDRKLVINGGCIAAFRYSIHGISYHRDVQESMQLIINPMLSGWP
jgi:hypothetical protein